MVLLVVSDSHGNVENMVRAVELVQPRMILHLGDCWRDGEELHDRFPELPFEHVPGNCDYRSDQPQEKLLEIAGKRILMCHGHTYHVKSSLIEAGYAAEAQQADLFLFGHTHRAFWDFRGKTVFLNPGAVGDYYAPSCGVVRIENGKLDASIFPLREK
ncbi:MAG: YfcE family phosphodiesterase [Oscillibacter sp.]|jgi:putative phosphoesterase|nr:YfcE family phosphodiesterase [Oscillibacter sp.]